MVVQIRGVLTQEELVGGDALKLLRELPDADRQVALNDFLEVNAPKLQSIGRSLVSKSKVPASVYLEDLLQELRLIVVEIVGSENYSYGDVLWGAVLYNKGKNALRHAVEMERAKGMRATSTIQRRKQTLRKAHSDLSSRIGRIPSLAETIEFANSRLSANAVPFTMQDRLNGYLAFTGEHVEHQTGVNPLMEHSHVDVATDFVLHPSESQGFIRTVLGLLSDESELVQRVADLWIGQFSETVPHIATNREIAGSLGVDNNAVVACQGRIRELAAEHLAAWLEEASR